ncbi:MAG: hypothetical protein SOU08_02015 [Anaerococcus sp.]|nr:hypothetical protein [Anaerococcus sp.]MDD7045232.1 hypothetical protein [Peptoniphilaceae bacterium]MDY2918403.1 hypothetical protein [Anaerococcus sp.]
MASKENKKVPKFDQWIKTAYQKLEDFAEELEAEEEAEKLKKIKEKEEAKSLEKPLGKYGKFFKKSKDQGQENPKKEAKEENPPSSFDFNKGGDFEGDLATSIRQKTKDRVESNLKEVNKHSKALKRVGLKRAFVYAEILDKPLALRKRK